MLLQESSIQQIARYVDGWEDSQDRKMAKPKEEGGRGGLGVEGGIGAT